MNKYYILTAYIWMFQVLTGFMRIYKFKKNQSKKCSAEAE